MNKRIEELAAKIDCMQDKYGLYHSDVWDSDGNVNGVDLEKFAELIVQSIADIDFRFEIGLTSDQNMDIKNLIKNHFGVK